MDGLPSTDKAGNVLRPETTVKISVRLPPTLDADKALARIKEILSENPPYGAEISFSGHGSQGWAVSDFKTELEQTLNKASLVS